MFVIAAAALAVAPIMASVPSPDPWSAYLASHRRQHHFALLLRKGEFQGAWMTSEELLRPRVNEELALSILEPETAAALWRAKEWDSAKWALLGRDGSILLERIPVFGPREPWAWGLPDSVHGMVMGEYQRAKAWPELSAWAQPIFDWMMEGDAENLAELSRFQTLVANPLIQSLQALGRTREANEISPQLNVWLKAQKDALAETK